MPVQKGKKRKRTRRRSAGGSADAEFEPSAQPTPRKAARPIPTRKGWQGPPWFNLTLGVFMIVAGGIFTAVNRGTGNGQALFFLIAYLVLGTFYILKALRQYRERREQPAAKE